MICGPTLPAADWPDAGEGMCCLGAAVYGPQRCTCWEPVYDLDQQPPRTDEAFNCATDVCTDCAYRPGSPENQGDDQVDGDPATLEALVRAGQPFWCHRGMRRPVRYVHPSGMTFVPPGVEHAYAPPILDGVPYQADGSPGVLCAGWGLRVAQRGPEAFRAAVVGVRERQR